MKLNAFHARKKMYLGFFGGGVRWEKSWQVGDITEYKTRSDMGRWDRISVE